MSSLTNVEGAFLVLSNLFLIPAILYTWELGDLPEFAVLTAVAKVSITYHLCQADFVCLFFSKRVLRVTDHFTVYTAAFWIALYFTGAKLDQRFLWFLSLQIFMVPMMISNPDDPWVPFILFGLLLITVTFIFYFVTKGVEAVHIINVAIIIALMVSGFFLFMVGGEPEGSVYAWTHIFWHILIMLAIYFTIDIKHGRNPVSRMARIYFGKEPTITAKRATGLKLAMDYKPNIVMTKNTKVSEKKTINTLRTNRSLNPKTGRSKMRELVNIAMNFDIKKKNVKNQGLITLENIDFSRLV